MNSNLHVHISKQGTELLLQIIAISLICFSVLSLTYFLFSPDIWLDEAYSLHIARYHWGELLAKTASDDVHPPLFYMLLKVFVDAGTFVFGENSNILFAKISSLVALICCGVITFIKIRTQSGSALPALLCASGVCSAYSILCFGGEVRMYIWCCLFVTATYLYAWDAITRGTKRDWLILCLFGLLAAYTHYYACISVAIIYGVLLLHIICHQRAQLKHWFCVAAVSVIGYLPWLFVIINQTMRVKESWWTEKLSTRGLWEALHFLCHSSNFIICTTLIAFILIVKRTIVSKKYSFQSIYYLTGISLPFLLLAIGLLLSWLFRPVLVNRYLTSGLGCMWIAIILILAQCKRRYFFHSLALILLAATGYNILKFDVKQFRAERSTQEVINLTEVHRKPLFLFTERLLAKTCQELTHGECYMWNPTGEELKIPSYGLVDGILTTEEEIRRLAPNERPIFYIKMKRGDDSGMPKLFHTTDYQLHSIENQQGNNDFKMGRYNFRIYRLTSTSQTAEK